MALVNKEDDIYLEGHKRTGSRKHKKLSRNFFDTPRPPSGHHAFEPSIKYFVRYQM